MKINAVTKSSYGEENFSDHINKQEIVGLLQSKWVGREVVFFEETGSTNVEAKLLADQGAVHGTLVAADSQSGGKGRRGRSWHSPKGSAIAMSLILKPELEPEKASMLTLIQAMAVIKALEDVCRINPQIKWPNDILVNEKKVCGILTEMNLDNAKISSVIIGCGINVNQDDFPEDIADIATSLKLETGENFRRVELIAGICRYFETYFEQFMDMKDLSGIIEEYNAHLISRGRIVKVLDPKDEFMGEAVGINTLGELLVKRADGKIVNVYAGEVSVRGIYGYV